MSTYVPDALRDELDRAQAKAKRAGGARTHVRVGDRVVPVFDLTDQGFSTDVRNAPHLRGFVEFFDGGRHLSTALIVGHALEGTRLHYRFKRMTTADDRPPLDYVSGGADTAGFITDARPNTGPAVRR